MSSVAIRVYAVIAVTSLVAYLLVPSESVKEILYLFAGVVCVTGTAAGLWLHRPGRPHVWQTVLCGMLLWTVADLAQAALDGTPRSSALALVPDVFYLLGYLTFALSLLKMIGGRSLRRDLAGAIESVTLTVALALVVWVVIGRPTIEADHENVLDAVVAIAYPTMDILLIAGLIRLILTPGARTVSFRLVLAAVWLLIVGDYGVAASTTMDIDVTLVRIAYFLCYVLWGAAALHPSMTAMVSPGESVAERFNGRRLAALASACAVAPGVLFVQGLFGASLDVWAAAAGALLLSGLVIARMTVAIRAIEATQRERERLQADLVFQASHDALTGLPNRARAADAVAAALGRAQRSGYLVALLFVDLDGFKNVNDTFGHATGDDVLRLTSERLRSCVRSGDVVARLGGDEFVVLLENLDFVAEALSIANDVVTVVSQPVSSLGRLGVRVGASVGLAVAQDASLDPDRLLREADAAVYRAKAAGRGRVEVFDDGLRQELAARLEFDDALARAIEHDELVVHYQPVLDVRTGRVQGYEALVRWERPGHGLVQPTDFVPAAERSLIVCDLDRWVMHRACQQLAALLRIDPGLTMAVNVSGRYLSTPRVVDDVRAALAAGGLAPQRLVVEITETALLEDLLATEHLGQLRRLGVRASLDDFGTGYASIARLRSLPIDTVKIDRSYVDETDPATASLLRLMIEAAHALGLSVVAEGVERTPQLQLLRRLGCESAQGFLLGAPATAAQLERARPQLRRAPADLR